jgi:hypothetical protein
MTAIVLVTHVQETMIGAVTARTPVLDPVHDQTVTEATDPVEMTAIVLVTHVQETMIVSTVGFDQEASMRMFLVLICAMTHRWLTKLRRLKPRLRSFLRCAFTPRDGCNKKQHTLPYPSGPCPRRCHVLRSALNDRRCDRRVARP